MILLSTYMMAIWANCQWIFYRLRPYKNLVNEPLWLYRIAVNSLFCLMAIAYYCQWCGYWPQLCRNSVNEWLTAIQEYCQRFSIVQGRTRQLSTYFLEKAVPEHCQWNTMAIKYYCQCFLAFFIISMICHKVQGLTRDCQHGHTWQLSTYFWDKSEPEFCQYWSTW